MTDLLASRPWPETQRSGWNQSATWRTPSEWTATPSSFSAKLSSTTKSLLPDTTSDTSRTKWWKTQRSTTLGSESSKNSSWLPKKATSFPDPTDGQRTDSPCPKANTTAEWEPPTLSEEKWSKWPTDASSTLGWRSPESMPKLLLPNGSIKWESQEESSAETTCGWLDTSSNESERATESTATSNPNLSEATGTDLDVTPTSPPTKPGVKEDTTTSWRSVCPKWLENTLNTLLFTETETRPDSAALTKPLAFTISLSAHETELVVSEFQSEPNWMEKATSKTEDPPPISTPILSLQPLSTPSV